MDRPAFQPSFLPRPHRTAARGVPLAGRPARRRLRRRCARAAPLLSLSADPAPAYFATCARGLGPVLAAELQAPPIHATVHHVASSGVRFRSTHPATAFRACLWLRAATRVLRELAHAPLSASASASASASLPHPDARHTPHHAAVYHFVRRAADWPALLADGRSFSVQVRVSDDAHATEYLSERLLQIIVKDAVCDAVRDAGVGKPPKPASHADAHVPLFVTVHDGQAAMYLDMVGASLHKRGWRAPAAMHRSSLNEAVAAGMLYMAGFRPDGSFVRGGGSSNGGSPKLLTVVDPMCGSGTLLIEAVLIRLRVAVGLYRSRFAFQSWVDYDEKLYEQVVAEAVAMQRTDDQVSATFIGNDLNPAALGMARRHLERVRLTDMVSLHHGDARELALPSPPTLVISNPPWGMRLDGEIAAWEAMGRFLRDYAAGCVAVFLSGDAAVTRGLRMRARQKTPVRIGNVDTRVLTYDVLPKRVEGADEKDNATDKHATSQRASSRRRKPEIPEREMPIL